MKQLRRGIIELFDEIGKELTTSQIVEALYADELRAITDILQQPYASAPEKTKAKNLKAELHRRLLYHLNKLTDDHELFVSKIVGRGEKVFKSFSKQTTSPVSQKAYSFFGLEEYLEKNILVLDRQTFHSHVAALVIDAHSFSSLRQLEEFTLTCATFTSDVIGIHAMQHFFTPDARKDLLRFLKKVTRDLEETRKRLSLSIDLAEVDEHVLFDVIDALKDLYVPVSLVFEVGVTVLQQRRAFLRKLFTQLFTVHAEVYFQNKDVVVSPFLVGKRGIYRFSEKEWLSRENSRMYVACVLPVIVDVQRFFNQYTSPSAFHDLLRKINKWLLTMHNMERAQPPPYLFTLQSLNINVNRSFSLTRNSIRFWNFNWEQARQYHITELLQASREQTKEFCRNEWAIYNSCGIPIRFKNAFATAFNDNEELDLSKRIYRKFTISQSKDLYAPQIKEFLLEREKLFSLFDGGDRLRIFRTGKFTEDDVLFEISILLANYGISFFKFAFGERPRGASLTDYFT
ncbi:MAG: hypothetical protein H6502_04455 [Candidatus Woesearchaeota archaeon]|nr:MAG: hypothetical protein H6502_04455 [Candidatus Woesearchaeota archaeon]